MKKNPLPGLLGTKTVWVPQPDPQAPPVRMVLQRTAPGLGNVEGARERRLQLRAHVIPADPRTPAQLAQRAAFAAAQTAFYALSPGDRDALRAPAALANLTARQYFTREFLKTYTPQQAAGPFPLRWDGPGVYFGTTPENWPHNAQPPYSIEHF